MEEARSSGKLGDERVTQSNESQMCCHLIKEKEKGEAIQVSSQDNSD